MPGFLYNVCMKKDNCEIVVWAQESAKDTAEMLVFLLNEGWENISLTTTDVDFDNDYHWQLAKLIGESKLVQIKLDQRFIIDNVMEAKDQGKRVVMCNEDAKANIEKSIGDKCKLFVVLGANENNMYLYEHLLKYVDVNIDCNNDIADKDEITKSKCLLKKLPVE